MITAILLAAGSARRFGSQKLLARLPDGRRVVEASAANLLAGAGRVIAVTRRDDALIRVLDDCGCQVVMNDHAEEGMGSSIAAGVAASAESSGWLVALGDMPFIQSSTISLLANAMTQRGAIVVPTYRDQRGHPVGFGAAFGTELVALIGDAGARSLLQAHRKAMAQIAVDDAGVVADIDTPQDLLCRHPA